MVSVKANLFLAVINRRASTFRVVDGHVTVLVIIGQVVAVVAVVA